MIRATDLREFVIKPALAKIQCYSDNDVELLIFTCAVESRGGFFLRQVNGPALGIFQMEPENYNDIWQNYITNKRDLLNMVSLNFNASRIPVEDRLIWDLEYAAVMCRIHYMRNPDSIPAAANTMGLWQYYKQYYNTQLGAAQEQDSIKAYQDFIESV